MRNDNANGGSRQGLAPSEKHLEDYLWGHPEALGMIYAPDPTPEYSFIFRQFRLPSGIVDLLGFDYRLVAFELKRGTVTSQALAQLLRYMCDLKHAVDRFLFECQEHERLRAWAHYHWTNEGADVHNFVRGVLIGNDVEDKNLLIACAACGVNVYTYRFDGSLYTFEQAYTPEICGWDYYTEIVKLSKGPLISKILVHFYDEIVWASKTAIKRHNQEFNAVTIATDYIDGLEAGDKDQ